MALIEEARMSANQMRPSIRDSNANWAAFEECTQRELGTPEHIDTPKLGTIQAPAGSGEDRNCKTQKHIVARESASIGRSETLATVFQPTQDPFDSNHTRCIERVEVLKSMLALTNGAEVKTIVLHLQPHKRQTMAVFKPSS
ncbi:hypothetical protein PR048_013016 [Dryococelus australis]|uniref:Uncharacterized protein n=1 Tax=Dryococelus australis TaxID=614101 RepID=A0ABQ9HR04_9NEOP|nr:hypothetical protein PR048_013016 [Dryococelus australis]